MIQGRNATSLKVALVLGAMFSIVVSTANEDLRQEESKAEPTVQPQDATRQLDQVLGELGIEQQPVEGRGGGKEEKERESWIDRINPFHSEAMPVDPVVDAALQTDSVPAIPNLTDPEITTRHQVESKENEIVPDPGESSIKAETGESVILETVTNAATPPQKPQESDPDQTLPNLPEQEETPETTPKLPSNAQTDEALASPPVPSIEELLQQAQQSPQLRRDAQIARLNERHRLLTTVTSTLSAAQNLASFGEAGRLMLRDAPLEEVIDQMIANQKAEQAVAATQSVSQQTPVEAAPFVNATETDTSTNEPEGLAAWEPVYVVRAPSGWEVGWQHRDGSQRASTQVGQTWHVDDDIVIVNGIGQRGNRRVIELTLNGELSERVFQ